MNLIKDGWKLSELKAEKRQLERQFNNAKQRYDILQMEATNYRLKIVNTQIRNAQMNRKILSFRNFTD